MAPIDRPYMTFLIGLIIVLGASIFELFDVEILVRVTQGHWKLHHSFA